MEDETITDATNAPGDEPGRFDPGIERDLSGATLNGYHLTRKIAQGGMGVVYEAIQVKLARKVALKIVTQQLASRPEFLQRFEREARAAAALSHPNLVQVHDFGQAEGRHYLVMEYVDGENLTEYVERNGPMPVPMALDMIEQAVLALKAARTLSIIHRDIKPSNLLLTKEGWVKVTDLGLAKVLTEDSDVTVTGASMGSPHFVAPEQAGGARHADHRVDIYGLGITLLFLLTGRKPYDGPTPFAIMLAHVNKPLPSGGELGVELPDEIERLIHRMAAKKPEDRYADYDELLADLQRVKAGSSPLRVVTADSRRKFGLLAGALVALCVLCAAGWFVWKHRHRATGASASASANPPAKLESTAAQPPPFDERPPGAPDDGRPPAAPGRGGPPGGPDGGGFGMMLPMGRPPQRPDFSSILTGPVPAMLAQTKQYAAAHKDDLQGIVARYRWILHNAEGTPSEEQVAAEADKWEAQLQRAADNAFKQFNDKMNAQLRLGKVREAYLVWKDFPSELRSRELDDKIRQTLAKSLPPDFDPQP
jgi:serine/threonine protein kinase